MKLLLTVLLSSTCFANVTLTDPGTLEQRTLAKRHAQRIVDQIESSYDSSLRFLTSNTIDVLIRKGAARMTADGYQDEADKIVREWETDQQFTIFDNLNNRHIGDHAPLSYWLRDVYESFKLYLGVEVCKALHISDIETVNSGVPVVFRPCSFPLDTVTETREQEYQNHFAMDDGADNLYGLVSVLTYWAVEIPCMVGTSGIAGLVCSPLSSIAEHIMGHRLAPKLSDRIFVKMCYR